MSRGNRKRTAKVGSDKMADLNEPKAETSGDEVVVTTGQKRTGTPGAKVATSGLKKAKTSKGEMVTSSLSKSETVSDVLTDTPTIEPATNEGVVQDRSAEEFVERMNELLKNNYEAINRNRIERLRSNPPNRPSQAKAPRARIIAGIVGAVCCLLVTAALALVVVTGTSLRCNDDEQESCTSNNATCFKLWYKASCKCHIIGQEFYGGSCRYKCDHERKDFCPDGICYMEHCFQDVFAFVTYIYKDKCNETATEDICSLTCTDILKYVCAANTSNPPFCDNSNPTTLKDFSCQSGNASDGFIELTADEEQVCMKDQYCRRLMTLYPCLAGYVNKGRVFCSKGCVVPKDRQGTTMFYNGYCFLKKANCDGAMTKLVEILNGSEIGYPYTARDFNKYYTWVATNLRRIPNLPRLLYPLMLAFGVLGQEGKVDTLGDGVGSASQFNQTLEDAKVQKLLNSLYTSCTDIIEFLRMRIKQKPHVQVYKDRYLRAAFLVSTGDCKTFNECPAINSSFGNSRIFFWAQTGGIYCSLSRALFSMNLTVNATWYESIAQLQGWPQLSTKSVSFIYSPSFVSNLISQTSYVTGARRLDDDVLNQSRNLCDVEENVRTINRDHTIIPMALSDALGWVENEPRQPKRLSSFALILANAVSVKKAICNEEGSVPSIDCELRLFLAFRAFLPAPCKEEKDLIANGDKASLYFTLRAAMRRQLSWGSKTTHFNNTNSPKISEAATYFVSQCLERIPN